MKLSDTQYFVIRHKESQEFMPTKMFRTSNRGFSCWRSLDEQPYDPTPRLFRTKKAAYNAIIAWARGEYVREIEESGGYFDLSETKDFSYYKDIGRKKSDLEIIPVHLELA